MAIQRVTKLQSENINLKYENQELQRENNRFKNYIEKTFEVIKNLFDFPIDKLKKLMDNFIENMGKTKSYTINVKVKDANNNYGEANIKVINFSIKASMTDIFFRCEVE